MIGNTPEYFQANNLIFKIMDMMKGDSIFDEISKRIEPSDIVNLALDILRIFMEIHTEDIRSEAMEKMRTLQDITESDNSFVRFADISIDCQRSNNADCIKVFSSLNKAEDLEELITKILIYGRL